jgi:hypothetical protein
VFLFFINYHLQFNNRVIEELSKVLFMWHMYRSSDLYDIIVQLNSVTDNTLAETIIQDICEIDNVNSVATLTIADDKINGNISSSFSLRNLRIES